VTAASSTVGVLCLAFEVSTVAHAQTKANLEDEVGQSGKAAKVFGEIMGTPDKHLPGITDAHVDTSGTPRRPDVGRGEAAARDVLTNLARLAP
jgi:hypothetical protein